MEKQVAKPKTRSLTGAEWTYAELPKDVPAWEGIAPPIARLLMARGIDSPQAIGSYLRPSYDQSLEDPFKLTGLDAAVTVILSALREGRQIGVHGDYDADGLTATALVADVLSQLGQSPVLVIPDRYEDGYGISANTLARLRDAKVELLITVDCGISNAREIADAKATGMQVVVTDHHTVPEHVPYADAVVNPQLPGDPYPNKGLAGVGVAFKLAQALLQRSDLSPQRREASEKWLLDLVAIGTVADLMPLTGENRTLVHFGLQVLHRSRRAGLQALAEVTGIRLAQATSTTIGYTLAPRLNAAGRMGSAETALTLLTTHDDDEARQAALKLGEANTNRQSTTSEAVQAAREQLGEITDEERILITSGPWKSGIVGLVAGKLVQEYHRPAVVIEVAGSEARGSARSVPGFDITAAISAQSDLLTTFGGHPAAGGFSLPAQHLEAFQAGLRRYAAEHLPADQLVKRLVIDEQLKPTDLSIGFVSELHQLEPIGAGNPDARFSLCGTVKGVRTVGSDRSHLKFELALEDRSLSTIGFGLGGLAGQLSPGQSVEVAGTPVINRFSGRETVEWQVEDVRLI
jgi:single-stranded-DNA-specific exonuclease